jgi:sugar phosphate isomerase/epimerase
VNDPKEESMTYKLAYSTLRWKTPDLEEALTALKEAGWDGWEGRLPLNWTGTPKHLRRICDNAGMPLAVFTANGSPDDRDYENVELNKRRMEFAAEMGCDCFMYMNGRKPEDRPVNLDDIKAAAEGADEWAEYAEQFGLELSFHIHTNLLVDSIEDWQAYMSMLDKAKLCIDVSHAQLWGYDPVESLRDFKDQLNYVHLQDYSSTSRRDDGFYLPVWVAVGEAESSDFKAIRKVLEETGYNRWVTGCPGAPQPGDTPVIEAQRSAKMLDYIKAQGY